MGVTRLAANAGDTGALERWAAGAAGAALRAGGGSTVGTARGLSTGAAEEAAGRVDPPRTHPAAHSAVARSVARASRRVDGKRTP
jgi:hypothetical protein